MKGLTYLKSLMLIFISITTMAQSSWNWPEDPQLEKMAKEKQAYYKVAMGLDNYNDSFTALQWLYENNANLNPSIYIDGVKVIGKIIKSGVSEDRKNQLQDSLLWMFDQRAKHFGNEAKVMDRKAYEAFKLYYKDRSKYPLLSELYDNAYAQNGTEISDYNLTPYMMLAKQYYEVKPKEMTAENVLEVHERVSNAIDAKMKAGHKIEKMKKEQDKVDAFLSALDGILTCEFISERLAPKLEENPEDIGTAKKIFRYSLQAKCTDQPYFTKAGETVLAQDPSYKLAKALADKYQAASEYRKAVELYGEAKELADTNEEKHDASLGIASAYNKLGNKPKSRASAYETIAIDPNSSSAYNLLGNLYFTSFEECKKGESRVLDRGVYLVANDMYTKAGNNAQAEAAKAQFPSSEEIFNEEYEVGQEIKVECWINKSTIIRRRD
ncbi:MAG: hypothetical protein KI790_04565 [Cyclobacteriaceae bacterium]|nr:hypothetical protein [Cyclobacteriaceae bacterium HetDA_MAG_MS6]